MLSEEDTSTLVEQTHNNSYHTFTGTEEVDLIYRYVCVLFVGNLYPSKYAEKEKATNRYRPEDGAFGNWFGYLSYHLVERWCILGVDRDLGIAISIADDRTQEITMMYIYYDYLQTCTTVEKARTVRQMLLRPHQVRIHAVRPARPVRYARASVGV